MIYLVFLILLATNANGSKILRYDYKSTVSIGNNFLGSRTKSNNAPIELKLAVNVQTLNHHLLRISFLPTSNNNGDLFQADTKTFDSLSNHPIYVDTNQSILIPIEHAKKETESSLMIKNAIGNLFVVHLREKSLQFEFDDESISVGDQQVVFKFIF